MTEPIQRSQPDFRIVSLCPSNTELVFALGLEKFLVGVDNYSDYPEAALRGLPRLGPDLNIDIDAVKALEPHLVISSLSVPGMEKVVDGIEAAGLNQIALAPHSIGDIFSDLQTVADTVPEALQVSVHCEEVIVSLRNRVHQVANWVQQHSEQCNAEGDGSGGSGAASASGGRPKLYWEWWPNPVFSPGRRNWLTEVSQLAGCVNIFADADADSVQDDGMRVAQADPDWFLAVWTGVPQHKVPLQKILNRGEGWQDITAYRKRQVYILSEGLFCRPSPRLVDGLEQLVGLLYPEAVDDLGLQPPSVYAPVRCWDGLWLGEGDGR